MLKYCELLLTTTVLLFRYIQRSDGSHTLFQRQERNITSRTHRPPSRTPSQKQLSWILSRDRTSNVSVTPTSGMDSSKPKLHLRLVLSPENVSVSSLSFL